MDRLGWERCSNIVILTGAGESVASGISPFRGPGGLWSNPEIERYSNATILQSDPAGAWAFWSSLREKALAAQPNRAHLSLVDLENRISPDRKFLLITQNIDNLHTKAGSRKVVEMHGNLLKSRCSKPGCNLEPFFDSELYTDNMPRCKICGSILRPDIVLFGEYEDPKVEWTIKSALRECDLFISVGTSGTVAPASNLVRSAQYSGARTVYINLEPMIPPNPYFQETVIGKAEDILQTLINQ